MIGFDALVRQFHHQGPDRQIAFLRQPLAQPIQVITGYSRLAAATPLAGLKAVARTLLLTKPNRRRHRNIKPFRNGPRRGPLR